MALKERGCIMYATYTPGRAPTWLGRAFGAKEAPGTYSTSHIKVGRLIYSYSAVGFPVESDEKTVVRFHAESNWHGELLLNRDQKKFYACRGRIYEFTNEAPSDDEAATRIRHHGNIQLLCEWCNREKGSGF